jgi:hypothetical protein
MWAHAAASIECAELCIKDHCPPGKIHHPTLKKISLTAAEIGSVEVLEWAIENDCEINNAHFRKAAAAGHVCVSNRENEHWIAHGICTSHSCMQLNMNGSMSWSGSGSMLERKFLHITLLNALWKPAVVNRSYG